MFDHKCWTNEFLKVRAFSSVTKFSTEALYSRLTLSLLMTTQEYFVDRLHQKPTAQTVSTSPNGSVFLVIENARF